MSFKPSGDQSATGGRVKRSPFVLPRGNAPEAPGATL